MSFAEYEAAGFKLCDIEPGQKGPRTAGWNVSPAAAESIEALGHGAGLLHVLSGTCALDIDDLEPARAWLAERGVDLEALLADPAAVMISSGRPARAKLLYRLKKPLRTLRPTGSGLELRCATADGKSVQDVLPPSVHPTTKKPYEWKYGDELIAHWSNIPNIPSALYTLWRELAADTPVREVVEQSAAPRPQTPLDIVRKAIKNYIETRGKDLNSYGDWLEIGMRLHKQTGGSQDGLDIWDELSREYPKYKSEHDLRQHYLSFGEADGKQTVGMDGLIRELPAAADEFPIETGNDAETTAEAITKQQISKLSEARAELEKRLVYVRGSEKYFDTQRQCVIQTERGIEHEFASMMPKRNGTRISPVRILKDSVTKTIVEHVAFHPAAGVIFENARGEKFANSYRNQLPAEIAPTRDELDIITWLFDRISDPVFREWYIQFLGHVVQHPGVKIKSAPLIWSHTQGNGKTTLVRVVPSLLVGPEYSKDITSTQLTDGFTGYLLDTWHVNLTEFRAGSRGEREGISKKIEAWIAEDVVTVRPMYATAYSIPNRFFVTASSNADDAASITNEDRKWAIHELTAPQFTSADQKRVYSFLNQTEHASAVLRHYFSRVDLTGFDPSAKAIETEAKIEMAQASVSLDVELITRLWEERSPPFDRDVVLSGELTTYVHKHTPMRPPVERIGRLLMRPPFNGVKLQIRFGKGRYRGVVLWNAEKWTGASGKKILDHIRGTDSDFDDPLLT